MAVTKKEILQNLVDKMQQIMESGDRPLWQKPWEPEFGDQSSPHNPITGNAYSGFNRLDLALTAALSGYSDPRWMGYRQAADQGWQVRKGEKATYIHLPVEIIVNKDKEGSPGKDGGPGGMEGEEGRRSKMLVFKRMPVFNAQQIDGIPPLERVDQQNIQPKTAELDAIAEALGVAVRELPGDRAFYRATEDLVVLPVRSAFLDQHGYDSTKAHELAHATGHEGRLGRDLANRFGSAGYAAEEVTAEIGAFLLCQELGVPHQGGNPDMTEEQHATYLASWATVIREKPELLGKAIDNGIKAAGYMSKALDLARERGLVHQADIGHSVDDGVSKGPSVSRGDYVLLKPTENAPVLRGVVEGLDGDNARIRPIYRDAQGQWTAFPVAMTVTGEALRSRLENTTGGVFIPPDIAAHPLDTPEHRQRFEGILNDGQRSPFLGDEHRSQEVWSPEIRDRLPESVRAFLGTKQAQTTEELMRNSEEREFFQGKARELRDLIDLAPSTYETDGKPDSERPVSLRYFGPNGAQWFIIEKDRGDPENEGPGFPRQTQAFGLADLGFGPEMGYVSIPEITRAGAELDYHFSPRTLLEVKREYYPELVREGPTVSRGDYVLYKDEIVYKGAEIEAVVLDPAQAGEATRLWRIYRWPNGIPGMDGADPIMPTVLPEHLMEHIPGAVQPGPDLDAIDPWTDAYQRTMGMDDARAQAEHAVLTAVETARGMSTQPLPAHGEQAREIHHKVVLTHRTDLADHVRQEPIDPDKPILEIRAHPLQRIAGVLRDYEKYAVLLDTREFGPVSVEIGKPFLADSLGDDYLRKSLGKPIEVSISGDGRVLSIHNPELGVAPAKDIFASPAIPFGLMAHSNMERKGAEEITGRLTHIHDTNVLEIQSAGQPLLVSGREPDARHQAEIRKLIGHTVTVTPNPKGVLQVADRGPKKEPGDSREIPVERLQPGDRIREGNHWMTVHSVEFPGDRIGLKNPVRIRFGDPEGDDTGSTLVPAGTRVSLRTAGILRPERSAFEGPEPAPTPDAPLPRHSEQAWEIHHKVVLTNRTDLIKAGDYIEVSHLKFASGGNERRISRGIVQSDHDGKAYQVHDIYGRGAAAKIMQGTGYLPGPENGGRVERHIPKAVPDLDKSAMLTFVHDLDERDQTVNELLDHPDWQVRANGIRDVIESMSGGQIHRALEDPDSVVRLNTLFLANRHGLAGRIDEPHARQLLSDPAPAVRGHAVGIFADRLGREGVEDFLTRETHQTPRGSAERALLRIQAEEQCLHPQFSQEAVIMPDVPETYGQRAEQQIQEPGEERAEPTGMHDAEEEIVEDLGWER